MTSVGEERAVVVQLSFTMFTRNFVVSVRRSFLFLGCIGKAAFRCLPNNYFTFRHDSRRSLHITKTSPCNENPLTPHFYIVKLGFTGVYIFLIFAPKHRLWVLVRTASLRRF